MTSSNDWESRSQEGEFVNITLAIKSIDAQFTQGKTGSFLGFDMHDCRAVIMNNLTRTHRIATFEGLGI